MIELPRVSINEEHYQQYERAKTAVSLKKTSIRSKSPSKSLTSARSSSKPNLSSRKSTTQNETTNGTTIWDKVDYRTLSYEQVTSINWLKHCQIRPVKIPFRLRNFFLITKYELRTQS